MKSCICLFLLVVSVRGAPNRKSKCRPPIPRLRMVVEGNDIIDLTHEFNETTPYHPIYTFGFQLTKGFKGLFGTGASKFFLAYNSYRQLEHLGTHMDSPNHFFEDGLTVSQVAIQGHLVGPGSLINMKHNGERLDGNYAITIDDILKWEAQNGGRIRTGGIVLFYTGYGDFFQDQEAYFGTNATGPEAMSLLRYPGLDPKAAKWLITNRCIGAVGIDTLSIDVGNSELYEAHQYLSVANLPIFENVGHLHELDARLENRFTVIALPQKISKGTGAPARMIAILD